ncbi:DUF4249 domain-containing protein [Edaphocola aurantiacus]|uniref:DUF4249 domain-containing protein n=1 Tax=Edaphocola aurantiacus TaxID=2601682 RepID=UPI001C98DE9F|nr:DUF4249 domain-containing protein [Edaphocola aurantiacus]
MRYTVYKLIAFLSLAYTMSSCRKEVTNIPLAQADDMAILQGYLNPDLDTITIALSVASGITKNKKTITQTDLEHAQVTIESNGVVKPLQFLTNNYGLVVFYLKRTELPILSGSTYTVRAKNGDKFSMEAMTTVPAPDFDFSFETTGPFHSASSDIYRIKTKVADIRGQENFYRINIYSEMPWNNSNVAIYYVTDDHDATAEISTKIELGAYAKDSGTCTLSVSNISEEYYKFAESLNTLGNTDGNPFAEPTRLYTNVQGGIGILASMRVKYKAL